MIFLKSYIQPAIIGGFILVLSYMGIRISYLKTHLAEAKAQTVVWQARVEQQNAAIDQLQRDSKDLSDKAAKAKADADISRKKAMEAANKIMDYKLSNDCQQVNDWLISQAHT